MAPLSDRTSAMLQGLQTVKHSELRSDSLSVRHLAGRRPPTAHTASCLRSSESDRQAQSQDPYRQDAYSIR